MFSLRVAAAAVLGLVVMHSAFAGTKILIMTPRGATSMEDVYREQVRKAIVDAEFKVIKTDPSSPTLGTDLAKTVAAEKPDLIYSWGTPTTTALAGSFDHPRVADVPIVFVVVADPIQARIVQSLEKPGRNVTGVTHLASLSSQVEAIRKYKPFRAIGLVYNPLEPNSKQNVENMRTLASQQKFTLLVESVVGKDGVADPALIEDAVKRVKERGADWLYMGPDTFVAFTHRAKTTAAAIQYQLPTFTANQSAIKEGDALYGLYAPVENLADLAAKKTIAILLLKKKPGEIPIETLPRFAFAVNACTARKLHMLPPMSLSFAEFTCIPKKD